MDRFKKAAEHKVRQAMQAAGNIHKVVTQRPIHEDTEFSPAFVAEKGRLRQSRGHLDQYAKAIGEYVASGREHSKAHRRMVQAMEAVVVEEQQQQQGDDSDDGERKAAQAVARAQLEVVDIYEKHLNQIDIVLSKMLRELQKEVKDARDVKAQCYQAFEKMVLWRSKANSMSGQSKVVDGTAFAEVNQEYKATTQAFLSLQNEATKKMAEFAHHKNIVVLESVNQMLNLEMLFYRLADSKCESFDIQSAAGVSIDELKIEYEEARTDRDQAHKRQQAAQASSNSSRLSTYEFTGLMPPMHNNEEVRVVIDQVENLPLMRTWTDSAAVGALVLTSYRIIFSSVAAAANTNVNENTSFFFSIPLRSIQTVRREKTVSDRKALTVFCKDTRVYSLLFRDPAVDIQALFQIFSEATTEPMQSCFAYSYLTASFDDAVPNGWLVYDANEELQRLGIGESAVGLNFRISHANGSYSVTPTYPNVFAVPRDVSDVDYVNCAKFRSKGRAPLLSWFHPTTGIAIYRSSQPRVGLNKNVSPHDQSVLRRLAGQNGSSKLNVFDARPRVNAVANIAMGGGWEDTETYPHCNVHFLGIENIHAVREAFQRQRGFEDSSLDMRARDWLRHIRDVLVGTNRIISGIIEERMTCLVHCSDGWDRTSQLTSLAMLLLDPYYRTVKGFIVLIEKEWITTGHQFAKRYGHEDQARTSESQRAPVFSLWLDCVYQISKQVPGLFEFNEEFLAVIMFHVTSCLFGTFLGDTERFRRDKRLAGKTTSLWTMILYRYNQGEFRSASFIPSADVSSFYPISTELIRPWDIYQKLGRWGMEFQLPSPSLRKQSSASDPTATPILPPRPRFSTASSINPFLAPSATKTAKAEKNVFLDDDDDDDDQDESNHTYNDDEEDDVDAGADV